MPMPHARYLATPTVLLLAQVIFSGAQPSAQSGGSRGGRLRANGEGRSIGRLRRDVHRYGLNLSGDDLSGDDRQVLIAFLKTL